MDEMDRWHQERLEAEREIARGLAANDIPHGFWFNLTGYMICNALGEHTPDGHLDHGGVWRGECARCGIRLVIAVDG